MKIIKILGGLGNQMFQYAFYIAMKNRFPEQKVVIDISCFKGYNLHNGFELNRIFDVNYQVATAKEIKDSAYPYFNYKFWKYGKYILPRRKTMYIEKDFLHYDDHVFDDNGKVYFDGYWQNILYFKKYQNVINKIFTFKPFNEDRNIRLSKRISSCSCLSIHIRRSDYLKHKLYKGLCNLDYYKKAISYVKEKHTIDMACIFSDDIPWCKEFILPLLDKEEIIFVDWNTGETSYRDMQLMSICKYNIIANSSFSWWGAWLNDNTDKLVVAPKKWINRKSNFEMNMDKDWIRI